MMPSSTTVRQGFAATWVEPARHEKTKSPYDGIWLSASMTVTDSGQTDRRLAPDAPLSHGNHTHQFFPDRYPIWFQSSVQIRQNDAYTDTRAWIRASRQRANKKKRKHEIYPYSFVFFCRSTGRQGRPSLAQGTTKWEGSLSETGPSTALCESWIKHE